jgi:hypothetical protein
LSPNLRNYIDNCVGRLRKVEKNFSRDGLSPDFDFNAGLTEYVEEVLPTQ